MEALTNKAKDSIEDVHIATSDTPPEWTPERFREN